MVAVARQVLWDVIEEHLDEAAYLHRTLVRGFDSCTLTLEDLARYPETGLLAHLDALVWAGAPVHHTLLKSVVASADVADERLTVVAWALLEAGEFDAVASVLGHGDACVRACAVEAVRMARHDGLNAWLHQRTDCADTFRLGPGLLMAGAARGLALPGIEAALASDDLEAAKAALLAARFGQAEQLTPLVSPWVDHPRGELRDEALLTLVAWRDARGWASCQRILRARSTVSPRVMELVALRGEEEDLDALLDLSGPAATGLAALDALGHARSPRVVPFLLGVLTDPDPSRRRVAAQSLGKLLGFRPDVPPWAADANEEPGPQPTFEEDDLEADLVPSSIQELSEPNVHEIVAFEARTRAARSDGSVFGAPPSERQLLERLARAPCSWRHGFARLHALSTGGARWLDTKALPSSQRMRTSRPP